MAIVIPTSTISDQYLEDTADAIRDQLGSQNTYTPSQFASAIMNIAGGEAINIQSLTVTPSLSQQTFNASEVHGYKPVVVNAIPSGVATAPASITETGANISSGTNTITLTQNVTITPTVSTGYISSGTSRVVAVSLTGSVSTKAAATITPSTSNQTIPANTFLTGIQTIAGDADLVAGNIKKGAQIFGVTGTYEGGGGGASNYVTGTFTVSSTSGHVETVTIPYTGSGYPIAGLIYPEGGPYNNTSTGQTTWYNSLVRYAVGFFSWAKSNTTTTPTFGTSGGQNQATVTVIYKNSTSTATTYTRTSSMTAYTYNSGNAAGTAANCVRFKGNGKTLTYYTATGSSSGYGLLPNITYRYQIIYSS